MRQPAQAHTNLSEPADRYLKVDSTDGVRIIRSRQLCGTFSHSANPGAHMRTPNADAERPQHKHLFASLNALSLFVPPERNIPLRAHTGEQTLTWVTHDAPHYRSHTHTRRNYTTHGFNCSSSSVLRNGGVRQECHSSERARVCVCV